MTQSEGRNVPSMPTKRPKSTRAAQKLTYVCVRCAWQTLKLGNFRRSEADAPELGAKLELEISEAAGESTAEVPMETLA